MPEEIASLVEAFDGADRPRSIAMRTYHEGRLFGEPCVLAVSRIGKVAAASTAVEMIATFRVRAMVLTGLAGALDPTLDIGDIVVADRLIQHDLSAAPIFPHLEIPLLGKSWLETDARVRDALQDSAGEIAGDLGQMLGRRPRVLRGGIATGDRFINSGEGAEAVRMNAPGALCVEMEGGAIAQVCYEHGVPLGVMRVISDRADEQAASDFGASLPHLASLVAQRTLRLALPRIGAALGSFPRG